MQMTQLDESVTTTVESTQNTLSIAGPNGDTRIMWDPRIPTEVDVARKAFKKAKEKGMLAYSVDPQSGEKGEVIQDFDPEASKIIMTQQLQGG